MRYSADFATMQALILSADCCGTGHGTRLPCESVSTKGGAEEMGAWDGVAGRVHRSERRATSAQPMLSVETAAGAKMKPEPR